MDDAEDDEDEHDGCGDEGDGGGDPGDPSDRRPGEGRQQQATQCFAAEQRVTLSGDLVDGALQFGDRGVVFTGFLGGGEGGAGFALGAAQLGVGGAVGDPLEVSVDEAGVGLGFVPGGDLFVGVADEVVAAFFFAGQAASGKKMPWEDSSSPT